MNYDIVTLILAQRESARVSRQALSDSPVIADVGIGPRTRRIDRLRANVSELLFALAGRSSPDLEHRPDCGSALASPGNTVSSAC